MSTAPAHLLETLAGLDTTLGDAVHDALAADMVRRLPDTELLKLTRLSPYPAADAQTPASVTAARTPPLSGSRRPSHGAPEPPPWRYRPATPRASAASAA